MQTSPMGSPLPPPAASPPSVTDQLRELLQLKAEGLIDEDEFQIMRESRLSSLMTKEVVFRSRPKIKEMFEENATERIHRWAGHQDQVQRLEAKIDQVGQCIKEMRQDQLKLQHNGSAAFYWSPMFGQQTVGRACGVPDWHESSPQQHGCLCAASDGWSPRSNAMVYFPSTSMSQCPLTGDALSWTFSAHTTPVRRQLSVESSHTPYGGGICLTTKAVQNAPPTAAERTRFQHETHFPLSDASRLSAQERFTSQTRRVHSTPVAGRWSEEALAIVAQREAKATACKIGVDTQQGFTPPRPKRASNGGDEASRVHPVVWSPVRGSGICLEFV